MINKQTLKAAILDVIDDGDLARTVRPGQFWLRWKLYDSDEAAANAQRLDFCDRVLARYAVLERNAVIERAKIQDGGQQ